jgi:hypothetical protein
MVIPAPHILGWPTPAGPQSEELVDRRVLAEQQSFHVVSATRASPKEASLPPTSQYQIRKSGTPHSPTPLL